MEGGPELHALFDTLRYRKVMLGVWGFRVGVDRRDMGRGGGECG